MKNKKLLSVLICALTALCCLVAASCSGKTAVDDKAAKGYTLTVKFDLGGGVIGGDENVSLMDMYRPKDYSDSSTDSSDTGSDSSSGDKKKGCGSCKGAFGGAGVMLSLAALGLGAFIVKKKKS